MALWRFGGAGSGRPAQRGRRTTCSLMPWTHLGGAPAVASGGGGAPRSSRSVVNVSAVVAAQLRAWRVKKGGPMTAGDAGLAVLRQGWKPVRGKTTVPRWLDAQRDCTARAAGRAEVHRDLATFRRKNRWPIPARTAPAGPVDLCRVARHVDGGSDLARGPAIKRRTQP